GPGRPPADGRVAGAAASVAAAEGAGAADGRVRQGPVEDRVADRAADGDDRAADPSDAKTARPRRLRERLQGGPEAAAELRGGPAQLRPAVGAQERATPRQRGILALGGPVRLDARPEDRGGPGGLGGAGRDAAPVADPVRGERLPGRADPFLRLCGGPDGLDAPAAGRDAAGDQRVAAERQQQAELERRRPVSARGGGGTAEPAAA